MNPDTFRIRVEGQIRFEYATCGWEYFLIRKEKLRISIQKYPDTCGRGLKLLIIRLTQKGKETRDQYPQRLLLT